MSIHIELNEASRVENTTSETTNSLNGLNSRLDSIKEKISYTAIKTIQIEVQSLKWTGTTNKQTRTSTTCVEISSDYIPVVGVPEGVRREKNILEEIMAKIL